MSVNTESLVASSESSPQEMLPASTSRLTTSTDTTIPLGSFTEREKNMRKYYKDDANKDKLKARIDKYKAEVKYLASKIEDLEKYVK